MRWGGQFPKKRPLQNKQLKENLSKESHERGIIEQVLVQVQCLMLNKLLDIAIAYPKNHAKSVR